MLPNHDTIEKMTLHWRGQADQAYTPATQMRVERRFSELDFSPPELPPNAVLFIRSIRSLFPLEGLDVIPQHWADEIRQQIITHYRQAVRPTRASIPPTAESLIFVDYAEMLTALTVAVIAGHWWDLWPWAELIPMLQPSDALSSAWIKYIQYLPAAFNQLMPSQMVAAVRLLTPSVLNRIVQTLRSAYDLPEISRAIQAISADESFAPQVPPASSPTHIFEAPWANWLPATLSKSSLSRQEYYLVGLLIGLHQSPAYVRSQPFTAQTARWLITETPPVASSQPEPPRRLVITTRSNDDQRPEPAQPAHSITASTAVDKEATAQDSALETLPDQDLSSSPALEDRVWTGYSGILYLINLLGWLGMPQQWDKALTEHVSAWGLLELLARGLLPADGLDPHDAIWGILAALDNRDADKPIGADFPPQSTFQLPASVLRRFASTQPRWRAAVVGDHLRLLDDTDLYLIAEQPLNGRDATTVIKSLLAEYQAAGITAAWAFAADHADEPLSPFVTGICSPTLQTWLARTIGFVRYWLRQIADLSPLDLLHISGRITVTYTHIDLFMAMETTDIRIRKVGLDRNPGWMPDFGYIIFFHFDE